MVETVVFKVTREDPAVERGKLSVSRCGQHCIVNQQSQRQEMWFFSSFLVKDSEALKEIIIFHQMLLKSKRESTETNQKCTTFRISQFAQSSSRRQQSSRTLFQQSKNRTNLSSKSLLKLSTKKTIGQSIRNLRHVSGALQALNKLIKINSCEYAELIARQIEGSRYRNLMKGINNSQVLSQIFKLGQKMYEEVYSYRQVEADTNTLHSLIKKLGSPSFIYRTFAFSGFVFFQYGSYSLSLYYLDKALKNYYDRDNVISFQFQKVMEIQLYKAVCRIFLIKGRYIEAKNFAYKTLRKAWMLNNIDEEMGAFDLLGKVYLEMQLMPMCHYFHYRMRSGERESPEILAMSKAEMLKQGREKVDFVCYQTINIFVDKDTKINDILENHYRVRSTEYSKETGRQQSQNRTIYVYTHHSPNRLLANYHLLERKMIEAKQSKELHFIRPKDSKRLKKIFSDFSALTHQIIQRINTASYFPTEFEIKEDKQNEEK